ncbi:MAG: hypothetical protein R3C39_06395 [Dehalococcoidia bacterium]
MSELRAVSGSERGRAVQPASSDGGGRQRHHDRDPDQPSHRAPSAAPELALALAAEDAEVSAVYEEDEAGAPRIRIVDRANGETVALLTPAELQALAATAELPPGLLLQTST